MEKIYICFSTDVIHEGHLNIIRQAAKYGSIIAGVMSDSAMVRFDRFPTVSFEERVEMLRKIPEISQVVVQNDVMYENILKELRPEYVMHGDNWRDGPQSAIRQNVIDVLQEWGGKLIEIPYTYNENVKKIEAVMREKLAMPEYRQKTTAPAAGNVSYCKSDRSAQRTYRPDRRKNSGSPR